MTDNERTEIALMRLEIEQIKQREVALQQEVDEMKRLDERRMRAAVVALGAAVMGMGTYIWQSFVGGAR